MRFPRSWPGGLFWRTFALLLVLIAASLLAWLQALLVFERTPRAHQIAQFVTSSVNVTRAALVHSDPDRRPALIQDLMDDEAIRIYPLEPDDRIEDFPDSALTRQVDEAIRSRLGADTRIAASVNGRQALWVSFKIDDDQYWVVMPRDRMERVIGPQWLGWGVAALLLSLAGAVLIVRFINQPMARLTRAADALSRGERPERLPDRGPDEIQRLNASFNNMVDELERADADRAVMLAGISHDLRTPLSRLALEVELSNMPEQTKLAVAGDIEQMDGIVGQFLHYARPDDPATHTEIDLSALVAETTKPFMRPELAFQLVLTTDVAPGVVVRGQATDLGRAIGNLVENARRYGHAPGESAQVKVTLVRRGVAAVIEVADRGPGIPASERAYLLRPFTRGISARTDATGSGLGFAVAVRVAERHAGRLELDDNPGGGLVARILVAAIAA